MERDDRALRGDEMRRRVERDPGAFAHLLPRMRALCAERPSEDLVYAIVCIESTRSDSFEEPNYLACDAILRMRARLERAAPPRYGDRWDAAAAAANVIRTMRGCASYQQRCLLARSAVRVPSIRRSDDALEAIVRAVEAEAEAEPEPGVVRALFEIRSAVYSHARLCDALAAAIIRLDARAQLPEDECVLARLVALETCQPTCKRRPIEPFVFSCVRQASGASRICERIRGGCPFQESLAEIETGRACFEDDPVGLVDACVRRKYALAALRAVAGAEPGAIAARACDELALDATDRISVLCSVGDVGRARDIYERAKDMMPTEERSLCILYGCEPDAHAAAEGLLCSDSTMSDFSTILLVWQLRRCPGEESLRRIAARARGSEAALERLSALVSAGPRT
jgi:hypothetical protein